VRSRKAVEAEVAGSRTHPVAEVGRSSEVCKYVNNDNRAGGASNPTGSSSAGVGTAVVDLHILRGIQIQDSLTFLLDDVIEKKKAMPYVVCLVSARRREALPNVEVESRCEAWNCLIQLWS
jgi:hypothetical protein